MYERYGLTTNPFVSEVALDVPPDTLDRFLIIDGFGEQKPLIDKSAMAEQMLAAEAEPQVATNGSDRVKRRRTQFALIHGNSGTGRSSVSNYIAHVFSQGRAQLKITELINDSAHEETFHRWMENFSLKAGLDGFVEVPKLFERVGDLKTVTPAKYVKFLHDTLNELQAKAPRVIALFEDVRNAKLFPLVQEVFDPVNIRLPEAPLVIFTTSDATISDAFLSLKPKPVGPGRITLRDTSGQDVLKFLSDKWQLTNAFPPHPFDEAGVVTAFESVHYPLKRAIDALNYIFDEKVKKCRQGGNWPHDNSLAINGMEIAIPLLQFDKLPPKS